MTGQEVLRDIRRQTRANRVVGPSINPTHVYIGKAQADALAAWLEETGQITNARLAAYRIHTDNGAIEGLRVKILPMSGIIVI